MNNSISPASITAAALVMQLLLCVVIAVGALLIRNEKERLYNVYRNPPDLGGHAWILLVYSLATVGLLVMSDQFATIWRPLAGHTGIFLVSWTTAIRGIFVLNIFCLAILVRTTGGSYRSPFTPVYFILPAMAFFLREPALRVVVYSILVSFFFVVGLIGPAWDWKDDQAFQPAYAVVSIGCLVLSVLIGFLTRPQ